MSEPLVLQAAGRPEIKQKTVHKTDVYTFILEGTSLCLVFQHLIKKCEVENQSL